MKQTKQPDRIKNTLIEKMFFAIATDEDMATYSNMLSIPKRGMGLATSYASKKVALKFKGYVEKETGQNLDDLFTGDFS